MTRIIIRGVPVRAEMILYLKEKLPRAEWCMDADANALHTFLRALRMAGGDPAVHMEDDTLLCSDFESKLETEIAQRPDDVIQFFSMRKDDLAIGSRYDRTFAMAQCFYLPAGMSRELAEWREVWPDRDAHPRSGYDILIEHFLKAKGRRYWIVAPNLVDHREAKSIIDKRRSSKRQSKSFARA